MKTRRTVNKYSSTTMDDLDQEIHKKIQEVAYQKAGARGLDQPGHEAEDWTQAEDEVLTALKEA